MPTYDYQCDACGHTLEIFQRITDEALKQCPACGKDSLRRLFGTGAAIVFKGSGFYQTDYRSSAYKSAAEKESKKAKPSTEGSNKPGSEGGGGGASKPSGTSEKPAS